MLQLLVENGMCRSADVIPGELQVNRNQDPKPAAYTCALQHAVLSSRSRLGWYVAGLGS
jgi:hypothetical protein